MKDKAYEYYCDFLNTSLEEVRESHHLALKMAIGLEKKREANKHFKFLYPDILSLNLDKIETKQFPMIIWKCFWKIIGILPLKKFTQDYMKHIQQKTECIEES